MGLFCLCNPYILQIYSSHVLICEAPESDSCYSTLNSSSIVLIPLIYTSPTWFHGLIPYFFPLYPVLSTFVDLLQAN